MLGKRMFLGPRKTSTRVIFKFMIFSAGVLFVGLLSLQAWYIHTSIQEKEQMLAKKLQYPKRHLSSRYQKNTILMQKSQECFYFYNDLLCRRDMKQVRMMKHIYEIHEFYFLVREQGSYVAFHDVTDTIETIEHIFEYSLWILLGYLIISYPLGVVFLNTIYKKLFRAVRDLEKNMKIDIDAMNLESHDELMILFTKINTALDSIKQFNTYVSHEIKTPLMTVSSSLDLIQAYVDKKQYKDIKSKILQMQKSLQEIGHIVDVLGKFIFLENKTCDIEKQNVDLVDILDACLQGSCNDFENIDIEKHVQGSLWTNSTLLSLLLKNVLENACKHGVSLGKNGTKKIVIHLDETCLHVENEAYPPKHIDLLHKKFYKEGNKSGLGLGLYLVKKIGELLHWKVEVMYKEKEGVFVVHVDFI